MEELEHRVSLLERNHATAREVALLREVMYGVIGRLDELSGKVDALVEVSAEIRRVQLTQGDILRRLLERGP